MNVAVITFPGSNCDRDIITAVTDITGKAPSLIWHKDRDIGSPDLVLVPGGFSFGDYLRCGAIAAQSPAMDEVFEFARRGGMVMGICNGFQILIETGLLPGALIRNKGLKFVCRNTALNTHQSGKPIMAGLEDGQKLIIPVAHNEGQFYADDDTLKKIEDNGQIAFTYTPMNGEADYNPNGAALDIAGITSENGRVLGLMPHPERMMSAAVGGSDGRIMLRAIIEASQS
ncbi:MAG: phosphoribosylformylglycinamidine synthase subunit PurQ [Alphaproteobacteria bacterium]|nr:phosphoribosylformylglycinamidine synthase subunit PurQ [Alphaproteobacteria bacterium]